MSVKFNRVQLLALRDNRDRRLPEGGFAAGRIDDGHLAVVAPARHVFDGDAESDGYRLRRAIKPSAHRHWIGLEHLLAVAIRRVTTGTSIPFKCSSSSLATDWSSVRRRCSTRMPAFSTCW